MTWSKQSKKEKCIFIPLRQNKKERNIKQRVEINDLQ